MSKEKRGFIYATRQKQIECICCNFKYFFNDMSFKIVYKGKIKYICKRCANLLRQLGINEITAKEIEDLKKIYDLDKWDKNESDNYALDNLTKIKDQEIKEVKE